MKSSDLRIGNFILSKDMPVQIEEIKPETIRYCFGEFPISYIESIPLTEEWLLKFGCEEIETLHTHWKSDKGFFLNGYVIFMEKNLGAIIGEKSNDYFCDHSYQYRNGIGIIKEIKYLHQLQNLYFALTGEELEIK